MELPGKLGKGLKSLTSIRKSENVRVICRFRPKNSREQEEFEKKKETLYQNIREVPITVKAKTVSIENNTERPFRFSFDESLWWGTSQEDAFESIAAPVCRGALDGFNGTVFAYGQTGSGKTHTILGPEDKWSPKDSGIVPRAANFFLHALATFPNIDRGQSSVRVSFLEIYRGTLNDLNPNQMTEGKLKIRQKKSGGKRQYTKARVSFVYCTLPHSYIRRKSEYNDGKLASRDPQND